MTVKNRSGQEARTEGICERAPLLITLEPWEQFCAGMLNSAKRSGWEN